MIFQPFFVENMAMKNFAGKSFVPAFIKLRAVLKNDKGRVLSGVMLGIMVVFILLYICIPTPGHRNSPTGWKTVYTHDENGELVDHSVRSRYPDY